MTTTDADLAALAERHPDVFPRPGRALRRWLPWVLAAAYLVWSFWYFEFGKLLGASDRVWTLLSAFVVWEGMAGWNYAGIYAAIAETLAMAFLGTMMASLGALVLGFLAARNVVTPRLPRHGVRRALDVFRGIDQLVWALVFVRAVGLGPLAGVLAIFVSDLGTLSKLYSEAIENVRRGEVEGVKATGAGPLAIVRLGYLPQLAPVFLSQSLYFFESATRTATILGVVGAGGIGMIIVERFRATLYDQVAFVVLNVLVVVAVIDWISRKIRERLVRS